MYNMYGDFMSVLNEIKPEKVFKFFEEISAIPRGSGHTEKIKEYCESFASERNLKYISDNSGNIIIFKNASEDYDGNEPVIIQGHTDMVWEKDDNCEINFETDGLILAVDGDYVYAKGTTLGGDDGIAVAMCLALLDSDDISHPPLEIVLTADEEIGMLGASSLDFSPLKSKRMINLDSEAEGTLWVSCAGGIRTDITASVNFVPNDKTSYEIIVSGLHGGHSGAEIHKGYANANKVMGRVLSELKNATDFALVSVNGGTMDNAITRDSVCVIASDDSIESEINIISDKIISDYLSYDPDIRISVSVCNNAEKVMDKKSTDNAVALLNELPSGVISMCKEIEGLVETSLNLGVLKTENNSVIYSFAVRSGVDAEKEKLCDVLRNIADKHGCNITFYGGYPAWEYKKDSLLRDRMSSIYKEMFGREMEVTAIHAGLECGLFCGNIKGLDCVSLGPDMIDIHTPRERLSISSTERTWRFLLRVLENI